MVGNDDSRICADCSATLSAETSWASINRGVIVCIECCYVHRSLGRHISQVRSLRRGRWHNTQLELIYALNDNNANNIWEHSLIDPQSASKAKKKPNSNDPVIPRKEAFIKAKYAQHAFAIRAPKSEESALLDLNKQLWSCARTSRVETTLRLLALGADPNYADAERGNSPLHIAAKENQALQVELLCIYGADVAQKNAAGHLPTDVARIEENYDLAARLEELEFDVSDRLSMFLCGRAPEHIKSVHFLVPELVSPSTASVRQFRRQLQAATSVLFEKLIQDVYDEVDRRETSAQWNALQSATSIGIYDPRHVAVFLPPNPCLSATRNQLRQKLAKYDAREFSQLIIDLLKEARRRYLGLPLPSADDIHAIDGGGGAASGCKAENANDLDYGRDYDEVAELNFRQSNASNSSRKSSSSKSNSVEQTTRALRRTATYDDILEMREKLQETNERLAAVVASNTQIAREMAYMQSVVRAHENDKLEIHGMLKSIQETLVSLTRQKAVSPTPSGLPPLPNIARPSTGGSSSGSNGIQRRASLKEEAATRGGKSAAGSSDDRELAAHFVPINSTAVAFPDNMMGEIEFLIVAIKRFFAEIGEIEVGKNANFHSDAIDFHIQRIIKTIPADLNAPELVECESEMKTAMRSLAAKCAERPFNADDASHCAYDVAKAAKRLLVTANQHASGGAQS